MKWKQGTVLGMSAWGRVFGNWSFLILKDNTGYLCSYKQETSKAILFNSKSETSTNAPKEYYYYALEAAMDACELKYKELLLR
jgi:hypothetical protein